MLAASPVRLTGQLDGELSRWLWLVKMFLALPHYVVLIGLGIAVLATTLVAAVAILVTARYPRPLFDFAVGVLRWNWRVGFYVYAALGTDRYPPFTLSRADYPAELDIAYPARLARALVLVKWLLALPHLVVLGLFAGVIMLYPWDVFREWGAGGHPVGGYSVINLLVVIAGFILLITGRYPASLFDFLVGLSRWVYRVLAYLVLMTDTYPPFRLDTGAEEPPHAEAEYAASGTKSLH